MNSGQKAGVKSIRQQVVETSISGAFLIFMMVVSGPCAYAAPDEDKLGKGAGYPIGNPDTMYQPRYRVGSFSGTDQIYPFAVTRKGNHIYSLSRAASEPAISYMVDGKTHSIDDYLARFPVTGLLIIKNGEILVERYQYERKDTHRFLSKSMAKSITSLALGIALSEGKIRSLDDRAAEYVKELSGFAYGETSLRDLLRMSSGVRFDESYAKGSDLVNFSWIGLNHGQLEGLKRYNERIAAPGERFHYATTETVVLGLVIRAATGKALADYVSEKIWQPMGAESDAHWNVDAKGVERMAGWFNAVLRDYGRLGLLLANDGELDGRQILPKDYLIEATSWSRHPPQFRPRKENNFIGYGYQFWLLHGEKRRFALWGSFYQAIYVDPELKLVMVHTAVSDVSSGDPKFGRERFALWKGIVNHFGKW